MKTLAGRVTLLATLACAIVFLVVGAVLIAEVGRRERATLDRELTRHRDAPAGARPARADGPARTPRGRRVRARCCGGARSSTTTSARPGCRSPRPASPTAADWRILRRGRLIVARPLADVEQRISELRRVIAITALLGLLACALAVRLITARALRPLAELRASAAGVSSTRDLTTRVPSRPARPRSTRSRAR